MPRTWRLKSTLLSLWCATKYLAFWMDQDNPYPQLSTFLHPSVKMGFGYWENCLNFALQSSHQAGQYLLSHKVVKLHLYKQAHHPQHKYVVAEVHTPHHRKLLYCQEISAAEGADFGRCWARWGQFTIKGIGKPVFEPGQLPCPRDSKEAKELGLGNSAGQATRQSLYMVPGLQQHCDAAHCAGSADTWCNTTQ
jgi:hypothetical protein